MTAGSISAWSYGVALVVPLIVACVSDMRSRRIPNPVVLLTLFAGIVLAVATKPWLSGLIFAGGGMLTGFAIWIPFYALGMLGAGDVKLFAAAATFLGARQAVEGALYTALYGGALAAIFMFANGGWSSTLFRIAHSPGQPMLLRQSPISNAHRTPYALAIAAGVLTALWWPGHILS